MRKIRQILRLVWNCNQSRRDTAKIFGIGKSTVDDTISRLNCRRVVLAAGA